MSSPVDHLRRPQEEHDANPANRLRLTIGLRKEQGRWIVAHEHHSFPIGDAE